MNLHQTFIVNGNDGWHMDGAGASPVPMSPDDVSRSQLEIWMNPHGFIKAARLPGANPKAVWRWELGEMGRDGPTTLPEKVHVVSIAFGAYRIDATINARNQIQRIHTMVAEPALGDFNYEHESTSQQTFGTIKWPTTWHSHQGGDDNYGFDTVSAGHNAFGGSFQKVEPNACGDPVPVPSSVRQARLVPPAITDGSRLLQIFYVQPLRHVEGMAMAYLPAEKILIEADLFDTNEPPPPTPTPAMTTLYRTMRMLALDVATIAPVHGRTVPLTTFMAAMGAAAKDCPTAGAGGSVVWAPCQ